nr:MAG TPA: hypothetical protein [Caudoviricetes sp.]
MVVYPFRVKCGGKFYRPGERIRVDDTSAHSVQGAVVLETEVEPVEQVEPVIQHRRRGRPPKGAVAQCTMSNV